MLKIDDNLDKVITVAGIVLLVCLIPVLVLRHFHPIYLVAVSIGIVCVIGYFVISTKPINKKNNDMGSVMCILSSFWFIMLAVIYYITRFDIYIKPLDYYIFSALSTGSAFLGVVLSTNKKLIYFYLALACSIGLMHIWTESLLFPNSLIGIDPWSHFRTTTQVLDTAGKNGVPALTLANIGGSYSLMHIYLNSIMDILKIDYKMASLIFVGSVQTVGNIVLVFLIGRELAGSKAGAIGSLMLASSNWGIFFGEWIIPNSIGATLSLVAGYLLILIFTRHTYWLIIPILVIILIGVFVHPIAFAWVVGTVCCVTVLAFVLDNTKTIKQRLQNTSIALLVPICITLTVIAWMKFSTLGNAVYQTAGQYGFDPSFGLTYAIGKAPELDLVGEAVHVVVRNPLNFMGELVLNSIGMLSYIGVALIGTLLMLKACSLNRAWVFLCVAVLAIGFFPPLFNISFIEHRWWYFTEVLLAIPLGVALYKMASVGRRMLVNTTILVILITFFSTIGLMSNMTNRDLSQNQIVRYAFTEQEMDGLKVAESYNPVCIGSDPVYLCFVTKDSKYVSYGKVEALDKYILSGDFRKCPADVILLRDALYKEPFSYGAGTIYKLEFNPVDVATKQGYKEVWHNEEIHCLIRY